MKMNLKNGEVSSNGEFEKMRDGEEAHAFTVKHLCNAVVKMKHFRRTAFEKLVSEPKGVTTASDEAFCVLVLLNCSNK